MRQIRQISKANSRAVEEFKETRKSVVFVREVSRLFKHSSDEDTEDFIKQKKHIEITRITINETEIKKH